MNRSVLLKYKKGIKKSLLLIGEILEVSEMNILYRGGVVTPFYVILKKRE